MDLNAHKQPATDDVFVTAKDSVASITRGVLVDVDVEGPLPRVLVDFPIRKAPLLSVGEHAELVFTGLAMVRPEPGTGRVILRSDDEMRARIVFLLEASAGRAISHGVNRRTAIRVEPEPEDGVRLLVGSADGGPRVTPETCDLSVTGISFCATREQLAALTEWSLALSILLPDGEDPVELLGVVRYQTPAGDCARVGVAFDFEHTPAFSALRDRLERYVTGCQVRSVQRAAEQSGAG